MVVERAVRDLRNYPPNPDAEMRPLDAEQPQPQAVRAAPEAQKGLWWKAAGPKWEPKSTKTDEKIDEKIDHFFDHFLYRSFFDFFQKRVEK